MVDYPVRVPRSTYRGRDRRKMEAARDYNNDAAILERYINDHMPEHGPAKFLYHQIAQNAGLSLDRVRKILFAVLWK